MTGRDLPILFSAAMVRALLAGTKTQTRRTIKSARVFATPESKPFTLKGDDMARALQNASRFRRLDGNGWFWEADAFEWQAPAERTGWMAHIGYAPGDRLYVREHWFTWGIFDDLAPSQLTGKEGVSYIADSHEGPRPGKFRQGMHMPRWASRITLTVTDERVERLQDISEADCAAEGMPAPYLGDGDPPFEEQSVMVSRWMQYRNLWNRLNGPGSWDANPWVAAYTFTVTLGNIDQVGRAA